MDSSLAAGGFAGLVLDPYLWGAGSSLLAGLAAGQALRALRRSRRRADADRHLRSSRFARAIAYLSLAILALAGLFVLADKGGLALAWGAGRLAFLSSCAAALAIGACAGRNPLALGLPLAALVAALLLILGLALEGWLPLRADSGSRALVARLLPYEVGKGSFRGQLELPERDSVPVVQDLSLAATAVGLRAECLELGEPLRLAACLVSPKARLASAPYADLLRLYRVAGLAGGAGAELDFRGPARLALLDAAMPLPADAGLDPGSPPARREALLGLVRRTRSASAAVALVPLQPLSFELALPDLELLARAGR
jgi:hypothetical protein